MLRWWIALVLMVAPATVWAQSSPPAVTAKAQTDVTSSERRVAQLTAQRNTLAKQYEDQLKAIDRLKQQRASWRRDRELKDALASAQGTAATLSTAAAELGRATQQLALVRRSLARAVDAELAVATVPARIAELAKLKAQLAPRESKRPTKIVLPDLEIDPLADPEELEAQAAELARAEQELARQAVGLDKQAKELDEVAKLRRAHERSNDLARRDDDQPQRTAREGGSRLSADDGAAAPGENSGGGVGSTPPPSDSFTGDGGSFETDAIGVLANVIDASTLETLNKASRSGDPTQRAQAAKRARDAVNGRLDQLRKKRAEIEAAAKARRTKR